MNESQKELEAISNTIDYADSEGLLPEVIWSAMHALKESPELSIQEALREGESEWKK
jgi:hypothetical protein